MVVDDIIKLSQTRTALNTSLSTPTCSFFPLNKINKIGFFGKEICEVPDIEEICLTAPAISAVSVLMIPAPLSVTEMNT